MKFVLVFVGKTTDAYVKEGVEVYLKRLEHYIPAIIKIVPPSTASLTVKVIQEESDSIMKLFEKKDFIIVLDEKGKRLSSREFSATIEKQINQASQRIVLIVGGAHGISDDLKRSAGLVLSMSDMTFTHQMIRLFLAEQLYRAMTIVRNEKYHHD